MCAELLLFSEEAGEICMNESLWPKYDPNCTLLDRARALLDQPVTEGPTDDKLMDIARATDLVYYMGEGCGFASPYMEETDITKEVLAFAREVLAKWGNSQGILDSSPQPVAVSERLPGPEDCDAEGRCWLEFEGSDDYEPCWTLRKMYGIPFNTTHWLPANALPTPKTTEA